MIIAYNRMAWQKGWPVGNMYISDGSPLKIVALLSVVSAFVTAFFFAPWYYVLIAVLISWFTGTMLTQLLGVATQVAAIVLWVFSSVFLFF